MSMPRKIRCSVAAIINHGDRVYSVDLTTTAPVPPFRPGQFLHLTVDDYDPCSFWPESRVFSIASSPRERRRLRICYSVKGRYTSRMEQKLKPGSEVWIKLPYGEFVVDNTNNAVLLAGGTGISAFIAFLEALEPQTDQLVTLVYGARAPELFLFQDMILARHARVPGLQVVLFSEQTDPEFSQKLAVLPRPIQCLPGRIALDQIWTDSHGDRIYYLSGPPAMLQSLGTRLRSLGVTADRIRTDAWD